MVSKAPAESRVGNFASRLDISRAEYKDSKGDNAGHLAVLRYLCNKNQGTYIL